MEKIDRKSSSPLARCYRFQRETRVKQLSMTFGRVEYPPVPRYRNFPAAKPLQLGHSFCYRGRLRKADTLAGLKVPKSIAHSISSLYSGTHDPATVWPKIRCLGFNAARKGILKTEKEVKGNKGTQGGGGGGVRIHKDKKVKRKRSQRLTSWSASPSPRDWPGPYGTWSHGKKYAAALFYLSHAHSTPINEAQWCRLNALQMQVAYGPHIDSSPLPEFILCSTQEKKRREEEWKAVSALPKQTAIKQFLDIMDNLFPNWSKSRPILEDFEEEWGTRPSISSHQESIQSLELPGTKSKSSLPFTIPRRRKDHKASSSSSAALDHLQAYEYQKLMSNIPRLPKLNAAIDAGMTVSRLKGDFEESRMRDGLQESRYYQLQRSTSGRAEKEDEVPKTVLTGLYETLTSGKLTTKSENEFIRNLMAGAPGSENAFKSIANKLEAARHLPRLPESAKFPSISASDFEAILRPKFEIQTEILSELENVLREELKNKAGVLALVVAEFHRSIDAVFSYLKDSEKRAYHLERKFEDLEFEYDTHIVTFDAMCEMYSLQNAETEVFGVTKPTKAEFQLEITRGLTVLKGKNAKRLQNCERNLSEMAGLLTNTKQTLITAIMEREKLIDCIKLLENSVFRGIETTFKGKSPPIPLKIAPAKAEIIVSKPIDGEIDTLRIELFESKKENELLIAKLRESRRRSSNMMEVQGEGG